MRVFSYILFHLTNPRISTRKMLTYRRTVCVGSTAFSSERDIIRLSLQASCGYNILIKKKWYIADTENDIGSGMELRMNKALIIDW